MASSRGSARSAETASRSRPDARADAAKDGRRSDAPEAEGSDPATGVGGADSPEAEDGVLPAPVAPGGRTDGGTIPGTTTMTAGTGASVGPDAIESRAGP